MNVKFVEKADNTETETHVYLEIPQLLKVTGNVSYRGMETTIHLWFCPADLTLIHKM